MIPVLDRRHPLAQGLVFCVALGYPVDLVSNAPGSFPAGRLVRPTKWGPAWDSNDGSGAVSFRDAHITSRITTQHTMFMAVELDAFIGSSGIISVPWNTGGPFPALPYHSMAFGLAAGGDPTPFTRYTVGGTQQYWEPGVDFELGPHTYVWTRVLDAQRHYMDGELVDSASTGSTGVVDFSGTYTEISLMTYSAALPRDDDDGRITVAAIWNRALSPAEVALFSADPKCVLVKPGAPVTFGPFPALTRFVSAVTRRRTGVMVIT